LSVVTAVGHERDFGGSLVSSEIDYAHHAGRAEGSTASGSQEGARPSRRAETAAADPSAGLLIDRLLSICKASLPHAYLDGEFVFRRDGWRDPGGGWRLVSSGKSLRYGAIAVLGIMRLPESAQRAVLKGDTCHDLLDRLAARLDSLTSPGDVALLCWAAAEVGHSALARALTRLAELDRRNAPAYVVDSAWVVSALVAARRHADVEAHLDYARTRLLAAQRRGAYPRIAGRDSARHRAHVGSFADQVYPIQALARLHRSNSDREALAVANDVAGTICSAQGEAGQWWWHYDSRTGGVVEGYPVYSVHQHAMAPMALMDLAESGGDDHGDAVSRGLKWLADHPETSESLILDDPPITWRKVARSDRRKAVRGLQAATTAVHPRLHAPMIDQVFPPRVVDHECRPYELGWLLMAWLS
jgi:hypothetical protein